MRWRPVPPRSQEPARSAAARYLACGRHCKIGHVHSPLRNSLARESEITMEVLDRVTGAEALQNLDARDYAGGSPSFPEENPA